MHAVLEKTLHELPAAPRGVHSAHPRRRQRAPDTIDREIVQFLELFWRAVPITAVGLVPNFPVPRFHLGFSVLFDTMLRPLMDELSPLVEILRWIRPPRFDRAVLVARLPVMLIWLRIRRERLGHEADLRIRLEPALQIRVEDA